VTYHPLHSADGAFNDALRLGSNSGKQWWRGQTATTTPTPTTMEPTEEK